MALVDVRVLHLAVACTVVIGMLAVLKRGTMALAWILLVFHCADTATYKIEQETARQQRVSREVTGLFDVQRYRFPPRRTLNAWDSPRLALVSNIVSYGTCYDMLASFGDCTVVRSPFRVQFCEEPVYRFFQAWCTNASPQSFFALLALPSSPAFWKECGFLMPKLQMFSRARGVASDTEAAEVMRRDDCSGDILLVADSAHAPRAAPPAAAFERLTNAVVAVREFSYDRLALDVDNPAAATSVLYYADAWHPFWRATVNGTGTPVMRANIAYKAVAVPPGRSHVEFVFGTPWSTFLLYSMIGIALLAFCAVVWLCVADAVLPARILRRPVGLCTACVAGVAFCAVVAVSSTARAGLLWCNLTRPFDQEIARHAVLLAAHPDNVDSLIARADLYCQRGDLIAAEADYTAAIAREPSRAAAYIGLCDLYAMMGDERKKSEYFAEAYRRCAGEKLPAGEDRTRIDDGIAALAGKIADSPPDADLQFRLAVLRLRAGDARGAAEEYGRMLDVLPPPLGMFGYDARGTTRMELGLVSQALGDYGEALRLKPGSSNYWAHFNRAHAALTGAAARVQEPVHGQ